jgi:hypothetical protein
LEVHFSENRQPFAEDVWYYRDKVRKEYGYLLDAVIDRPTPARFERKAIARALVVRGYLQIGRRRVPRSRRQDRESGRVGVPPGAKHTKATTCVLLGRQRHGRLADAPLRREGSGLAHELA